MGQISSKKLSHRDGLYSADIDWFLNISDFALGVRSSLAAQITCLERNGSHVTTDHEPYTDQQLGWGKTVKGAFDRNRRLNAVWARIDPCHQRALYAHYVWRLPTRTKLTGGRRRWAPWPLGVEGQLGQLAGAALMLAADAGHFKATLKACAHSRGLDLVGLLRGAEHAVRQAHEAFRDAQQSDADAWVAA